MSRGLGTAVSPRELLGAARAAGLDRYLDERWHPERSAGVRLFQDVTTLRELLSSEQLARLIGEHHHLALTIFEEARRHLLAAQRLTEQLSARPAEVDALVAWAAQRGVSELLEERYFSRPLLTNRHLVPPALAAAAGPYSLRDLLADGMVSDRLARLHGASVLLKLRSVGWAHLEQQAQELKSALEADDRRNDLRVADGRVQRVIDALLELRREIRRTVPPRNSSARNAWMPPPVRGPSGALRFEYVHPELGPRGRPIVTITVREAKRSAISVTCTGCDRAPACTHVLGAIDALLDDLVARAADPQFLRSAAELATPEWVRVQDAVERALAAEPPSAEGRLVWKLTPRPDGRGVLALEPHLQQRGKSGEYLRARRARRDRLLELSKRHRTEGEELALSLIYPPALGAFISSEAESLQLTPSGVARAVKALAGHPRVFLETASGDVPIEIRLAPLRFELSEAEGGAIAVELSIDGVRARLDELPEVATDVDPALCPWIDVDRGRCYVLEVGATAQRLIPVLAESSGRLPAQAREPLLLRLFSSTRDVGIGVSSELKGRELPADPQLVLRLDGDGGHLLELLVVVRPLAAGPEHPPGSGPEILLGVKDEERVHVVRNLPEEERRAKELETQLGLPASPEHRWSFDDPEEVLALLSALDRLTGVTLEWAGPSRVKLRGAASARDLELRITRRRDWFGVEGGVTIDRARIELAMLLDAARKKRRFLEVAPGEWIELSARLREQLLGLSDLSHQRGAGVEIAPVAALQLEELLHEAKEVTADRAWKELRSRIERGSAEAEVTRPAAIQAALRNYQVEGHHWLRRLSAWQAGAVLADDMGLGKTIQALAILADRAALGPALVVAPTSVCGNWRKETQRFAPRLRPMLYREIDRRKVLETLLASDVLIVSYGLLVRDREMFTGIGFATLVLDEAHALKNPETERAKTVAELSASWRLALTGTPVENHLGELWSLFRSVSPGFLGNQEEFRRKFVLPIERDGDPERRRALARLVRPFILRRTKDQVARDLPPKTEVQIDVELSEEERSAYEDARLAAVGRLSGIEADDHAGKRRIQILAEITRLRLLACDARLGGVERIVQPAKLRTLLALVEELRAEGHTALVFSQFTKYLDLVRAELEVRKISYAYLDGSTPAAERERQVEIFQRGERDVFLLSLKAGGTGLNLTRAHYVIHLDPWWNPAVEDQATDRAHRIGQTHPVTVYRLISRGTIEESILALHLDKRRMAAALLEGAEITAKLSTEELLALVRGDAPPGVKWVVPELLGGTPAGLRELAAALRELLELEVAEGVLTASTAKTQARVLEHFVETVEAGADFGAHRTADSLAAAYAELARSSGKKSDARLARPVLSRLWEFAEIARADG